MQDVIITRDIGFEALTISHAMRLVFSIVPGDNFNPIRGGEKPFTSYPELPDCPYYSAYQNSAVKPLNLFMGIQGVRLC